MMNKCTEMITFLSGSHCLVLDFDSKIEEVSWIIKRTNKCCFTLVVLLILFRIKQNSIVQKDYFIIIVYLTALKYEISNQLILSLTTIKTPTCS